MGPAPYAGSDTFLLLKPCVMMLAIFFFLSYTKLSNMLSQETLYVLCIVPFVIFFALFGFVLYPLREVLHASPETVHSWQLAFPRLSILCAVVGYWSFSLFYIFGELWGNIGVAVLFWQFANQVTKTAEAQRFYPLFGISSQLATVVSGFVALFGAQWWQVPVENNPTEKSFSGQLFFLTVIIVSLSLITLGTYLWMQRRVLTNPLLYHEADLLKKHQEPKPRLSMRDSLGYILRSSYLGYITVLVLSFNICMNLVEITWKGQVAILYANSSDYNEYMGFVYIISGTIGLFSVLGLQNLVRRFGWYSMAVLTPLAGLLAGFIFFASIIFDGAAARVCTLLGIAPIALTIALGLFHNVVAKAAKYALFDPSKEMAYIPLDEDLKIKGKVAVDVVGGRTGKAGGGIIQLALKLVLDTMGCLTAYIPGLCCIFSAVSFFWVWVVGKLSREYSKKTRLEKETPSPLEKLDPLVSKKGRTVL